MGSSPLLADSVFLGMPSLASRSKSLIKAIAGICHVIADRAILHYILDRLLASTSLIGYQALRMIVDMAMI